MSAAAPIGLAALDPVISTAAAAGIAVILLVAALDKLREPALFGEAVRAYALLPEPAAALVARLLPWLEAAAGVLLLPASTRAAGATLALGLLALVTGAVLLNIARGHTRIDCGCGGDQPLPLDAGLVARNLALLGVAALARLPVGDRPPTWLDAVCAAFGTLALLALHALATALVRNHSRLLALRNAP